MPNAPSPAPRSAYNASRSARAAGFALVVAVHLLAFMALWQITPARNAIVASAPIFVQVLDLPKPPAETPREPWKPLAKPKPAIVPTPAPMPPEPVIEMPMTPAAPAVLAIALPVPAPAPQVEVISRAKAEVAAPVTPPRFDADYLRNPSPTYPAISRRLGEQGRTLLRVLVGADGSAREVELKTSSGYERLDRSALDTVRNWKFVPARVGREPVSAWVLVPIAFALEH